MAASSGSSQQTVAVCSSSSSSGGAGSRQQQQARPVMPRASLLEPAHAARWLRVPTVVVRDRGGARGAERGHSAAVCRGHERGHERAERRGQIRRWWRSNSRRAAGRQRRLAGGPGGNPHVARYLGSRPEGWQQRRGSQSQPRPVVQRLRGIQDQLCPLLTSGLSRTRTE